ncbi:MAG: NAD(P)-dependent oxidoreductase [Candidatus Poseidonia sp.]|nr:NAD(P)-dependent oxidoreductase [Poseidonia sp.]
MRVVVTGATGSLGQALLVRLRQDGYSVVGLGRSQHKTNQLRSQGFEMKHCDITNLRQVKDCFSGSDIVIHCAAFAAPFGSKKKFFDTNVEGTKNIFQAAKENSVSRIVVISSASIFDGMNHDLPHGDNTPVRKFRPRHPYGASKYDAEIVCISNEKESWIGLRPRAVFGRGDQTLIPRLKKLIGKNHYNTIGAGEALVDITCLSNFIDAVCLAIVAPRESLGQFYNISNGDPRAFRTIMETYTSKFSKNHKQRKIPYVPVLLIAHLLTIMAMLVPGKKWEPSVTPYGLRQVTKSLILDTSGAQKALNWTPKKTFEQGMEELDE